MKYTRTFLLAITASMCCTISAYSWPARASLGTTIASHNDDDDNNPATTTTISEDEMPEGLTMREIDSLLNDWTVRKNLGTEEACDPSNVNPDFPRETYIERLQRMQTVVETPYNDIVRSYIDRYAVRARRGVTVMLGASNFYMPIFEEALESYQVPLELKYLPVIESALNPNATSPVGAAGLWQFMIGTGKKYGLEVTSMIDERRDPIKSSYAAAHFLSDLYKIFGDWTLCIAAYNCGPGNVTKAIKRAGGEKDFWAIYPYLPKETRGYVPAYIAATYIFNYYCDHNICPVETRLPAATDTIMITRPLHLKQIATVTGMDIDEVKALNPQYRTSRIPGNAHPCTLRLPLEAINTFIEAGDQAYDNTGEYFTNRSEVSVGGETPSSASNSRKTEASTEVAKVEPTATTTASSAATTTASATQSTANGDEAAAALEAQRQQQLREEQERRERYEARKEKERLEKERRAKAAAEKKKAAERKARQEASRPIVVKEGDNLYSLASKYNTTVAALKKANGLKSDIIRPGQKLKKR